MNEPLDFIFFINGFTFLLLAVMSWIGKFKFSARISWRWLAWFGLLHGASAWLDLLALGLGDSATLTYVRLTLMSASFLPLVEFGRLGMKMQGVRMPGGWLAPALLALAGLGALKGIDGLHAACHYVLGVPGGLLAGLALCRETKRHDSAPGWPLRLAGLGLIAYGLISGLAIPAATFFPASAQNQETFLAAIGFHIQQIRAICAAAITLGVWLVYREMNWGSVGEPRCGRCWVISGLMALLLVGGWWGAQRLGKDADKDQRAALLAQATAIARTIAPEMAQALSFTSEDKGQPEFECLRAQFISYSQAINLRSIYSMTLRGDGRIVFGPEGIPGHAPQAILPGTVYQQPPAGLREVFQSQQLGVVGPYTDAYGTFVSAFVPILAPRTGKVLLMVGMDLNVKEWQAAMARARIGPILFTMIMLLIATAGSAVLAWRKQLPADRQGWWGYTEAILTAAAGLALTGAAASLANRAEVHSRQANFAALAQMQVGGVREVLLGLYGKLDALARFFETNPQVSRQTFHAFAEPLARDGHSQAWAWVPVVPAADRLCIEAQARRNGLTDFAIYQQDAQGNRVPVAERDVYYPVLYTEPQEKRNQILGYDHGSEPVRRAALEEAARTGLPTATNPVLLLPKSGPQQGILIDHPVFTTTAKERKLFGFVSAVVRIGSIIQYSLARMDGRQPFLIEDLFQLGGSLEPQCLASSSPNEERLHRTGKGFQHSTAGEFLAVFPLFIFSKAYALVVHPEAAFLALDPMWDGKVVALGGLLLTAVLSSFVVFLTNRRDYLERQILVRTTELRQSEARMRAITDSAYDAILMMDPQGRISYWNPGAERIFDYSETEALGQKLHEILLPERYRNAHISALPEFLRTGQGSAVGKTLELYGCRKSGEEIAVTMSLSAVQIGRDWHAVGVLRDETERKQAKEILLETNRQLKLATTRANDMAAQAKLANVAKSEFLANMSHEIRTPMNGIVGMTGLLLDTQLGPEQRQYAEVVRASGEALLALINNILDFSKIEARKLDLEILDFDLRLILEDTTEILAVKAQEKGLELACLMAPEVPSLLRGDPGRLRQILINLVGNAIKFTHQGEVSIYASLVEENCEQAVLLFEVRDTGIGIPSDKLPILFSPFTQADGSITRKYGGTGLGLAISRQLAELMSGQIGVESEEGRGSTFWFTAKLEKQAKPALVTSPVSADLSGVKILVVDNHDPNRLLLATLLKTWGCRFAEAIDGESALTVLRQAAREGDPFQVALIDMLVPGMGGAELSQAIKGDKALRDMILLLMTSLAELGDATQRAQWGISGYLTKPLRQAQLYDCLAQVLGRNALPAVNPGAAPSTRHPLTESRKHRLRILLAEDNSINQLVALKVLEKLGYRADAVANGQEAIAALQNMPYDLVLMDCQMPQLDGFETTRRIRNGASGAQNAKLPIIAMTAHAIKGDRERCIEAGMNDYLSKPVQPRELAEMLERWLNGPTTETAASEKGESSIDVSKEIIFDRAGFMARILNDEGLAVMLIEAFLSDLATQKSNLALAVAAGDSRQTAMLAHKLKGAASNLGALALQQIAAAMEDAGEAKDLAALRRLLPQFEEASGRLSETLNQIRNVHEDSCC